MAVEVSVRGFGWTHAGRSRPALEGVDLDIASGQRLWVCGDSGSGKSTLVAALAGVLGGDEEGHAQGAIVLTESGVSAAPGRDIPVGLVLQDPDSQVIAARVGDDVAFGCENMGIPREETWRRVRRALDLVGLDLPLDHPTTRLSGGQKQRLALAGVVAMGAGLIIVDEPTANLDPAGARAVAQALGQVADSTGATLVVVEHQPHYFEGILEHAVRLEQGRLVESGPFAQLASGRQPRLPQDLLAPELADAPSPHPALWSRQLLTRFGPERTVDIAAGASTVITGANGAGKTTLLQTLGGLLRPRAGEVGVAQHIRGDVIGPIHTWSSRDLARRVGSVFQNPEHQFLARTVREELGIAPRVLGRGEGDVDALLQRLRLDHVAEANPFTLSGGEKRRLSVATALIAAPEVLLLDEPTFGQDPTTLVELLRILRGLVADGITVAAVSHDPLYVQALGDYRVEVSANDYAAE
ncbi:ABC transporter ATP-binding protein [Corynebacterium lizhenjunii]|uniref:ABC transporter ATP-binding protein n=1 Tax=Corynebacterium lizhenjunii TaxID=2709394 RepID=A0A7T0KGG5_9CORY|nr:ABC transporter ATP-binding protein [Corynebacterium lizhenjunii]QPK79519.1 ABC transporter ATP-binding protein [Corynebacterium lizhenjunii]